MALEIPRIRNRFIEMVYRNDTAMIINHLTQQTPCTRWSPWVYQACYLLLHCNTCRLDVDSYQHILMKIIQVRL